MYAPIYYYFFASVLYDYALYFKRFNLIYKRSNYINERMRQVEFVYKFKFSLILLFIIFFTFPLYIILYNACVSFLHLNLFSLNNCSHIEIKLIVFGVSLFSIHRFF